MLVFLWDDGLCPAVAPALSDRCARLWVLSEGGKVLSRRISCPCRCWLQWSGCQTSCIRMATGSEE